MFAIAYKEITMPDQQRGSKPDVNLEGARDSLEKKGSGYKDQLKETAEDLSRGKGRDIGEQRASRSDRDMSRDDLSRGGRELSDSSDLDRDEGGMKSSQGQQGDPFSERNRREIDQYLDPSDS
jgi:hypothetical protein